MTISRYQCTNRPIPIIGASLNTVLSITVIIIITISIVNQLNSTIIKPLYCLPLSTYRNIDNSPRPDN